MIAGFHRPLARYGGPDQPVDVLNHLDPGLEHTHPVHIHSDRICVSNRLCLKHSNTSSLLRSSCWLIHSNRETGLAVIRSMVGRD
jgi:hypothetical protein